MTPGRDRSCPVADPESVKCGGGWKSVEHADKFVEIMVVQLQVKLTANLVNKMIFTGNSNNRMAIIRTCQEQFCF